MHKRYYSPFENRSIRRNAGPRDVFDTPPQRAREIITPIAAAPEDIEREIRRDIKEEIAEQIIREEIIDDIDNREFKREMPRRINAEIRHEVRHNHGTKDMLGFFGLNSMDDIIIIGVIVLLLTQAKDKEVLPIVMALGYLFVSDRIKL